MFAHNNIGDLDLGVIYIEFQCIFYTCLGFYNVNAVIYEGSN